MTMTIKQMKQFLLSRKGLTPAEKKEIEHANEKDIKDMFEEFKKHKNNNTKVNERFTDVWF